MPPFLSLDTSILSAWRGQLAATGKRLGLRTYLLQLRQELLPHFAAAYRQLRTLPRRLRKALQRRWGLTLAGMALTLTLQPLSSEAATFTAGTPTELVTAINTANSNAEADTIMLTANITLTTGATTDVDFGPTGLPVVSGVITIVGNNHTIRRDPRAPKFRLLTISNGALTVQNTTLSGGSAPGGDSQFFSYQGGGILSEGGLSLEGCTVSGNTARSHGGGVATFGGALTITNSTISGNTARFDGGGLNLEANTVTITNSTISGNTAGAEGGGVFAVPGVSPTTITNSTISGNTAKYGGGVQFKAFAGATIVLTNSTVSGNTARENGGGVASFADSADLNSSAGSVELSRNLISGNTARTGAEVFHYDRGGLFSATLNLFGHNGLTTTQAFSGVPTGGTNRMATSDGSVPTAMAAILDTTLQNNGGLTLTHNLVLNSPAIDTAGATCGLTMDQRGAPRPVDGDGVAVYGVGGAACDIGAVEFSPVPSVLDCSSATASVDFPRLGNRHRYKVTIRGVTAPKGDNVGMTINGIFQDEPVTSATGSTCPDGIGVGTEVAKVRNERIITSAGDGRVYHIGFTAIDEAGASCTGEVQVCVPVKQGEGCGDQGALFDSTTCP